MLKEVRLATFGYQRLTVQQNVEKTSSVSILIPSIPYSPEDKAWNQKQCSEAQGGEAHWSTETYNRAALEPKLFRRLD